jgi:hypothetical protein
MANFRQNAMRQSIQMQHMSHVAKSQPTIIKSTPESQPIEEPIAETPVEPIIEAPIPEPVVEVQPDPVIEQPKPEPVIEKTTSRLPSFKK